MVCKFEVGRRRQELEAAFAESAELDEGWSLRSQSARADIDLIVRKCRG